MRAVGTAVDHQIGSLFERRVVRKIAVTRPPPPSRRSARPGLRGEEAQTGETRRARDAVAPAFERGRQRFGAAGRGECEGGRGGSGCVHGQGGGESGDAENDRTAPTCVLRSRPPNTPAVLGACRPQSLCNCGGLRPPHPLQYPGGCASRTPRFSTFLTTIFVYK